MTPASKWKVTRLMLTAIYLMGGWMLFTASLDSRSLLMGGFFSFLVAAWTYRFFFEENEVQRRSLLPHFYLLPLYLFLLLVKMYIASFALLWRIVSGRINPRVVHFRTRLKSDIARVVLTNSITLTPGTITLTLDDDHLIVHWLNARTTHSRFAGELICGDLEKVLKKVWI